MRAFVLGLIFSARALPCLAQTVLKSEPLILAPYEIAFVQDPSCPVGKVLKVTGAIRGLHRRKACVTLAAEQASPAVATPAAKLRNLDRHSGMRHLAQSRNLEIARYAIAHLRFALASAPE